MQCPECQSENREGAKFCSECGYKFEISCPKCGNLIKAKSKFCDECGCKLGYPSVATDKTADFESPPSQPTDKIKFEGAAPIGGERKHVTVLFSDLTGYTTISEKLDPEEVKEITSRIFGKISNVVAKYDGFIEKYAGDAVMAIFGVPQAHEDDPVRAIKAAREIHQVVDAISPDVENKIGEPISMHTGINTGLVVTGEVNMERGTHGVAGDTINLAARLSNLAKPGEILVNVDTCRRIEGHFICEYVETTTVKGKADLVQVHKVLSERDEPITIRRLSGLRSDLVGRTGEMAELTEAVESLEKGKGRIFSICGAAGTGKSRLIEEFKTGLDLAQIQWIEGHAYAYSQGIPYFPLVDLLNRLLQINGKEPLRKVRKKVEIGIASLVGNQEDIIPYVGGLYSLSYPETEDVSPEFWRSHLQTAILRILASLAEKAPTVFFLEDLHWADSSFVELLRKACLEIRQPAIVLCAYRPTFSLFSAHQLSDIGKYYHEIKLQNLSLSVAQNMLESLLKTDKIPPDLKRWVNSKAEGNPFYLEELINSLIESGTLISDNGSWKLVRSLSESDIPSSLHGLISGRLDRLEKRTKRILQEASVIGRDFLYEILKRITKLEERIDGELIHLERLDLIRTRSLQPELEYMFKHALTQEVAYNSLLKKVRKEIHERVGQVMEQIFSDRLTDSCEELAFHYRRGTSVFKAVEFLILSGEKSYARYALVEANEYYNQAYKLLSKKENRDRGENKLLLDLILAWGYIHNCMSDFKNLEQILLDNSGLSESLGDGERLSMFYAWLGHAYRLRQKLQGSYEYLHKALQLAEKIKCRVSMGYANAWLCWTCAELGLLDEAVKCGQRAKELVESHVPDPELIRFTLAGLGSAYFFRGDCKETHEIGQLLLDYGRKKSDLRCISVGHFNAGQSHYVSGDFDLAIQSYQKSIQAFADSVFSQFAKLCLGMAYVANGQIDKVEDTFETIIQFADKYGTDALGDAAQFFQGIVMISKGSLEKGFKLLEDTAKTYLDNGSKYRYAYANYTIGKMYMTIAYEEKKISFSVMAKNITFLAKNLFHAKRKAKFHFEKALEVAQEIGAKGILGMAYMDLARIHKISKKNIPAENCIDKAIKSFERCNAIAYLNQAIELKERISDTNS